MVDRTLCCYGMQFENRETRLSELIQLINRLYTKYVDPIETTDVSVPADKDVLGSAASTKGEEAECSVASELKYAEGKMIRRRGMQRHFDQQKAIVEKMCQMYVQNHHVAI